MGCYEDRLGRHDCCRSVYGEMVLYLKILSATETSESESKRKRNKHRHRHRHAELCLKLRADARRRLVRLLCTAVSEERQEGREGSERWSRGESNRIEMRSMRERLAGEAVAK